MDNINKSTNKPIIVLLVVILIAVLGIGGYFIIKDIASSNKDNSSSQSQNQNNDNNNSDQGGSTPSGGDSGDSGNSGDGGNSGDSGDGGSSDQPVSTDIDASITVAETRGVNFHIEAQTNGVIYGKCDISLVPTDGTQGHHNTVDLAVAGQNSVCTDDVSVKGLNPGEHKLTVVVLSTDGRTKTLEQIIKI